MSLAPSAEVRAALDRGDLELPLPGRGRTAARWSALRQWGAHDLSVAKLVESHTDAVAILHEANRQPTEGALYAVWASGLGGGVRCRRTGAGYELSGTLQFASAARDVDRALLAARADDESVLLELDLAAHAGIEPLDATWHAVGMAGTDSVDVRFDRVVLPDACVVGTDSWYLTRPGFWIGAVGVAAVWLGALDALVGTLRRTLEPLPEPSPHRLAHLGACITVQHELDAVLADAARQVDAAPGASHRLLATVVRSATERGAQEVLARVDRALGAGPRGKDAEHARRTADLPVYLRQHHAERDLEDIGRCALAPVPR